MATLKPNFWNPASNILPDYSSYILYSIQASTMKGVLREARCHQIVSRQPHGVITSMNFPHSKIWSMALQAWKPDLSAKLEQSHISEVDLQLKEHRAPKSDVQDANILIYREP